MSAEDNAAAGCGPVMSRKQVRQAAQVYYEATPGTTLLEVARRFNVGESYISRAVTQRF